MPTILKNKKSEKMAKKAKKGFKMAKKGQKY
jgi:hypothetical protein